MLTYLENVDFADASYASSRRNLRDCPLQDGEHYGGRVTPDSSFLGPEMVSEIDENLRMEVIDWMLEVHVRVSHRLLPDCDEMCKRRLYLPSTSAMSPAALSMNS